MLRSLLRNDNNKFYVDVGCNHPFRDNNSILFYSMGWRGINIDANSDVIRTFNKLRPTDKNVNCGVSDEDGTMSFYMFQNSSVNTFSKRNMENNIAYGGKLENTIQVNVRSLESILRDNITPGQQISFLTIDVEGFDLKVLRSNNWQIYRPKIVLVEINDVECTEIIKNEIGNFMLTQSYIPYAKTINNWLFVDETKFTKKPGSNHWFQDDQH